MPGATTSLGRCYSLTGCPMDMLCQGPPGGRQTRCQPPVLRTTRDTAPSPPLTSRSRSREGKGGKADKGAKTKPSGRLCLHLPATQRCSPPTMLPTMPPVRQCQQQCRWLTATMPPVVTMPSVNTEVTGVGNLRQCQPGDNAAGPVREQPRSRAHTNGSSLSQWLRV